jgi:hypothetical protein
MEIADDRVYEEIFDGRVIARFERWALRPFARSFSRRISSARGTTGDI